MTKESTLIDHTIRRLLGITVDEYVIMDYLSSIKKIATYKDYLDDLGFEREQALLRLKALKERGLIVRSDEGLLLPTKLWKDAFKVDDRIDEIWPLHPAGTKAICRKRLPYVLKKISLGELQKKLSTYLDWCKANDVYSKNLDTWLNPKSEHWNASLQPREKKLPFGQQPAKKEPNYSIR